MYPFSCGLACETRPDTSLGLFPLMPAAALAMSSEVGGDGVGGLIQAGQDRGPEAAEQILHAEHSEVRRNLAIERPCCRTDLLRVAGSDCAVVRRQVLRQRFRNGGVVLLLIAHRCRLVCTPAGALNIRPGR